ncbi:TraB/GumN family protein [Ostreiculturibacter nitratireducens]|uniref:TraB/GumN family protein n=1 Tax=Ostreiculturibacter nitratireducens TaxID=3075226 RepID=UPI0031B5A186
MLKHLFLAFAFFFSAGPVTAACEGRNLLGDLPPDQRAALDAAVAAAPYAAGNHWIARKSGSTINVIGTFHLYDERMEGPITGLDPVIRAADAVYLEATDAEMTQLQREIGRNPDILVIPHGDHTLPELLAPDEWALLSEEMRARGIPPFMAAKFRPWYVTMLLSMPPCAMETVTQQREGLDQMVMGVAEAAGVPTHPLEEFDTVFQVFLALSAEEQIDMVRATLPLVAQAEDLFVTMTEAYFTEEHRRIWELSRLQAVTAAGADSGKMEKDFALMEEALLNGRNRAWMEVILPAAENRSIVVAVGAAHLSGEEGVLNLLAEAGYELGRLPF